MTNRELAKIFNISPTAFSLIINNKPGISDDTRNKVVSELREMGYGHLIKKEEKKMEKTQNRNLCFVIFKRHGEILDLQPFFLLLMENLEQRTRKYGYNMLLSTIDLRLPLHEQIEHLNNMDVDGAIVFATEMNDEDVECFEKFGRPYVILDNNFMHLPLNTVSINNEMGTYQAVEYLVSKGHHQIGYLKGTSRISSFREREKGYREAMEELGLELKKEFIFSVRYSEEGSYQDFRKTLQEGCTLPTAFVSDDDTIAVGVMRALREFHYRIPEDVSIVGYNDRPMCDISSPKLTTINVSKYSFAAEAVDTLVGIIQNSQKKEPELRTKKIRIETRLLIRESVCDLKK